MSDILPNIPDGNSGGEIDSVVDFYEAERQWQAAQPLLPIYFEFKEGDMTQKPEALKQQGDENGTSD